MKKRYIILIVFVSCLVLGLGFFFGIRFYNKWRIENAVIDVKLKDNLDVEVYSEAVVSDFIKSINGKIIDDYLINTKELGKKEIKFKFINDDDIEVKYSFNVNVVDTTKPWIFSSTSFSINKGYTGNLEEELFCGDNYDNDPSCTLTGYYDYNTVGSYPLTFTGVDSSGNTSITKFNLVVKNKGNSSSGSSYINYSDVVSKHKNENTMIGLDVSRWQGDINFQAVKDAGVEFVFVRVGSQRGVGGEYYIDPKFHQNIKGFNEVGIPVGIYFYSYADSVKSAKAEAKWVVEQLKGYKVDLPVVFDWENWSFFQEFGVSFYNLTEIAKSYLKVVETAGYEGMLYSSKNYLENVWYKTKYPVWLAHYTEKTTYEGEYKVWQLCANGRVSGINGNVDINVMYK